MRHPRVILAGLGLAAVAAAGGGERRMRAGSRAARDRTRPDRAVAAGICRLLRLWRTRRARRDGISGQQRRRPRRIPHRRGGAARRGRPDRRGLPSPRAVLGGLPHRLAHLGRDVHRRWRCGRRRDPQPTPGRTRVGPGPSATVSLRPGQPPGPHDCHHRSRSYRSSVTTNARSLAFRYQPGRSSGHAIAKGTL